MHLTIGQGGRLKILGTDLGLGNCGYAIIEANKGKDILIEAGLIKIKPSILQYQITELCEGLDSIPKNHSFDEVAIGDIFFVYNPKTVLKPVQSRGAPSLKILQIHGDLAEYIPLQVKKTVTGKTKATKGQVAFMVKRLLELSRDIKPLGTTDVIAVALTHAANLKVRV